MNCRFGSDAVISNGPVAGGGFSVMLRNGVFPGTGVAIGSASR